MGRARQFAWAAYDHLGSLFLFNALWGLLSLPWLALGGALFSVGMSLQGELAGPGLAISFLLGAELVLFAPPGLLLFLAGRSWAAGQEVQARALLKEVRRLGGRAQLLGLLLVAATSVLLVNILFYQRLGGWLGLALSGTMLWLLVALLLGAVFFFPVLISLDSGVWQVLRQSFLLAFDNPRAAIGLLLAALLILGLGLATGIGLFCGGLSALALLVSISFRRLCFKYTGEPLPEEPPRQWRELIRPWEM